MELANLVTGPRQKCNLRENIAKELFLVLGDEAFYDAEKPDVAIIAAARVGGIGANSAANSQFLYENELIALNTVWSAAETALSAFFS